MDGYVWVVRRGLRCRARVRDMTPAELVAWMAWRVRHRAVSMLSGAAREVREMRYGRGAR